MNRRIIAALLALFGTLVIGLQPAAAQKGGKRGAPPEELEIEGQVKQVTSQGLIVETADGTKYGIGVGRSSQLTLQGEASKAFLAAGTYLEFEAELDHAFKSTHEPKSLTIVNVSTANPAGLFPQTVLPRDFIRDEKARATFLVRGKMLAPRDGALVVQTGQKIVTTKMAEGYTVAARFDNWALATAGDVVKGTVQLRPQPNTGIVQVTCQKLTIDAAQPIEPLKAKADEPKPERSK